MERCEIYELALILLVKNCKNDNLEKIEKIKEAQKRWVPGNSVEAKFSF